MAKITLVGAGSTVFARYLLGDILGYEELTESEITLFDIDAERLDTSELVARRVADALKSPAKIRTTTDHRAALDGADYAINMIQVGGYEPCTVTDFEIPKRFGLRQTIGDTLGIGGIMRGLRTIPVMLSMCADMEELCPDTWFFNYTGNLLRNGPRRERTQHPGGDSRLRGFRLKGTRSMSRSAHKEPLLNEADSFNRRILPGRYRTC